MKVILQPAGRSPRPIMYDKCGHRAIQPFVTTDTGKIPQILGRKWQDKVSAGALRGLPIFWCDFMWHEISTAPFNRDLELAVIDTSGARAFGFPCRRVLGGWVKADTKRRIDLRPTHWREWSQDS